MHGGRGLAFWYTKDSKQSGPIFGSKDKWDGLSIWLDSANPVVREMHLKDQKKKADTYQNHKASTMAILNDGTLSFASGVDPRKHALGTCSITYRNSPTPAYLKVTLKDNTLTVCVYNLLFLFFSPFIQCRSIWITAVKEKIIVSVYKDQASSYLLVTFLVFL